MQRCTASVVRVVTVGTLAAASGLHVAWGRGSSFPFATGNGLTDNVVGSSRTPSPTSCYAVASGLAAVGAVTACSTRAPLRRAIVRSTAAVLAVRAAFGFAGRTDLLVPGSASRTFRRNDRWLFSPICAALALGLVASASEAS
jgi:hypothetical protein